MIKVNLLKELTASQEASPKRDFRSFIPEVNRLGLLAALLILIILGALGWFWWYAQKQNELVSQELAVQRSELDRLNKVRQIADNFEKQKRALGDRIQIIEKLRNNQTGPVQLLNVIIACIPEQPTLWLEVLSQKDKSIRVEGYATEQGVIPEFIKSLEQTGFFQSVNFEGYSEDSQAVKFSMTCVLMEPKKGEAKTTAPAAEGTKARS